MPQTQLTCYQCEKVVSVPDEDTDPLARARILSAWITTPVWQLYAPQSAAPEHIEPPRLLCSWACLEAFSRGMKETWEEREEKP